MLLTTTIVANIVAQSDKSQRKSPPVQVKQEIDNVMITIDYSSPRANGRELFGGLVPYNEVWRTGANEATTITVSQDVRINNQELKVGTYALFSIPGAQEWTIIFNSVSDQWGAYDYDASKDALKVITTVESKDDYTNEFSIDFNDGGFVISWGNVEVPVAVSAI